MSSKTTSRWEQMRDSDSRQVEGILRTEFPYADAYRYNSASIRVRVIDERFRDKAPEERDAMVERLIEKLPQELQADIINLITLYPGETATSRSARVINEEFEEPSPSEL